MALASAVERQRAKMEILGAVTIFLTVLMAMNVGGNNSAAEMGPAFGAGVRTKREALILIAVFGMIGAVVAGERVVETLAGGLVGEGVLKSRLGAVVVILASAAGLVGAANWLRVPVATSHAMVGAVAGMGFYLGFLNWNRLGQVVGWWLVTPVVSLGLSYVAGKYVSPWVHRKMGPAPYSRRKTSIIRMLITGTGCYMAFSAGSNSLAKSVGPVVGAGIWEPWEAALAGGVAMSLGALLIGGRIMETMGKQITPICPINAMLIEGISGSIILAASRFGMPVSLAEIVTCGVIGFSYAHRGFRQTSNNRHVRRIYLLWPLAPTLSAGMSCLIAAVLQVGSR